MKSLQESMNSTARTDKFKCAAAAAAVTLLFVCFISVKWDFYWDLNDDFMIDRLLTGAYTGEPAARDIQNMFPFSFALSRLQILFPFTDWYALILCLCQFGALFLVLYRLLCRKMRTGAVLAVFLAAGMMLQHLVFIQYSVTVGILGAAAAFWFLTMESSGDLRGYLRGALPGIALMLQGYLIRSEMMLFMTPLCALAILFRTTDLVRSGQSCGGDEEERKSRPGTVRKTALLLACAGLVLGASFTAVYAADKIAYGGEWASFRSFFDARTKLYDFADIRDIPYDENRAFYESIGVTRGEVTILENYNFGLDEKLDESKLQAIAGYAYEKAHAGQNQKARIRSALWNYRKSLGPSGDMPYSMIAFTLYGLVVITALLCIAGASAADAKDRRRVRREAAVTLVRAGLVFLVRSALLLYLQYNNRPVARLTHSLYLAEAVLLAALLLSQNGAFFTNRQGAPKALRHSAAVIVMLALFLAALSQYRNVAAEYAKRESVNADWNSLMNYTAEHQDSLFLIDVYSSVDFSEKMFGEKRKEGNWDLLGGWVYGSPLQREKLAKAGYTSFQKALLSDGPVYLVCRREADTSWLASYFEDEGMQVMVNAADTIGNYWTVYKADRW